MVKVAAVPMHTQAYMRQCTLGHSPQCIHAHACTDAHRGGSSDDSSSGADARGGLGFAREADADVFPRLGGRVAGHSPTWSLASG